MVYIMNSPVLTNFGLYKYSQLTLEEAKKILSNGFISAVGHQATVLVLSQLLGIDVPYNRISIKMEKGDKAIVFRVKVRLEEGVILNKEEILNLFNASMIEIGLMEKIE